MTISRTIVALLFVLVLIPAARGQLLLPADKALAVQREQLAAERAQVEAQAQLRLAQARRAAKIKAKAVAVQTTPDSKPSSGGKKPSSGPSADDPFGEDVTPPAEVKKKDAKSDLDAPPAAPAPKSPVDPQLVKMHLQNGSTISGRLTIKHITLETSYGTLTIPIAKIKSITPGLGSDSPLGAKINSLIEQLGGDVFAEREAAEKSLLGLGLPVREALRRRLGGDNEERQRRLKKLLVALEEVASEQDDFAPVESSWIQRDTVVTTKFTAYGSISPKSFQIESKYGLLTVRLGDIRTATRHFDAPPVVRRHITLDQSNLVQRGFKSSGIRVEKGDLITIIAEGTLSMTPWGSNYSSTPNGGSRFGNYKSGIFGGTLIAKIGSGSDFKVGSEHRFSAKATGLLQFAIAMQKGFSSTGNQFPGSYSVRIKVEKPTGK